MLLLLLAAHDHFCTIHFRVSDIVLRTSSGCSSQLFKSTDLEPYRAPVALFWTGVSSRRRRAVALITLVLRGGCKRLFHKHTYGCTALRSWLQGGRENEEAPDGIVGSAPSTTIYFSITQCNSSPSRTEGQSEAGWDRGLSVSDDISAL